MQLQSRMRSYLSMHEHYGKAGVSRCIGSDPDTMIFSNIASCIAGMWSVERRAS
jgi:hypothetical protein